MNFIILYLICLILGVNSSSFLTGTSEKEVKAYEKELLNRKDNISKLYNGDKNQKYVQYSKNSNSPLKVRIDIYSYPKNNNYYLTESLVNKTFEKAINIWAEVSNIKLVKTTNNEEVDKIISIDFNYACSGGSKNVLACCWMGRDNYVSFMDNYFWNLKENYYKNVNEIDLLEVAVHEFGHALSLEHTQNQDDIMYPSAKSTFKDINLSENDKRRIIKKYGKSNKINKDYEETKEYYSEENYSEENYSEETEAPKIPETEAPKTKKKITTTSSNIYTEVVTQKNIFDIKNLETLTNEEKKTLLNNILKILELILLPEKKKELITKEILNLNTQQVLCKKKSFKGINILDNMIEFFTDTKYYLFNGNLEQLKKSKDYLFPLNISSLWNNDFKIDATTILNNKDRLFFKDDKYYKFDSNYTLYENYPKEVKKEFPFLTLGLNALSNYNDKTIFIKKDKYWVLDNNNENHICNYPNVISFFGLNDEKDLVNAIFIKSPKEIYFIINNKTLITYDSIKKKIVNRFNLNSLNFIC